MKQEVYDRLADLGTARESMGSVVEKLMDDNKELRTENEKLRAFYEKYKDQVAIQEASKIGGWSE